jgi:hypothetical protein
MLSLSKHAGRRTGVIGAAFLLTLAVPAHAEAIRNPVAVFSGLDKITGSMTTFEVAIDETRRFGALSVRPRVCYSRPVTEQPKTTSFVEVEEALADGQEKRIFTGWMLAESPGLNAIEHPIFDVWLIGCRDPNAPEAAQEQPPEAVDVGAQELPKDND